MANVGSSQIYEQSVGDRSFGYIEFRVTSDDLTAAALTEALDVPGFPANAYPLFAQLNVGQFFTGGSVSAATVQLGDAGDPDGLAVSLNVLDTTSLGDWGVATAGVEAEYGSTGPSLESAFAPQLLVTTVTANVDQLTTGVLHGRIYYKRYED